MFDFIFRSLLGLLVIVAIYTLALAFVFRTEIRATLTLRLKYRYTWRTAWGLACTDCYLQQRLKSTPRSK